MNGYETIYNPASNSKGALRGHNCRPDKKLYWTRELKGLAETNGSIICCDSCGQHWFLRIGGGGAEGLHTAKWYKVRWYHFNKKKRILGIE